jgi:dipeptidyl-peptidase-4
VAIDDLPGQLARTRYLALGVPRAVTVSRDGGRVLFLRTRGGEDPLSCLWRLDLADSGPERLLAVVWIRVDDMASGSEHPEHRRPQKHQRQGLPPVAVAARPMIM